MSCTGWRDVVPLAAKGMVVQTGSRVYVHHEVSEKKASYVHESGTCTFVPHNERNKRKQE